MRNKKNTFYIFLIILIICKVTYWLFTSPNADEAYYWLWGQFPALSYYEHPALQSLTQNVSHKLFGNSLFALRLPVIICFIFCSFIFSKILKKMNYSEYTPMVLLTFFSLPLFFLFTTFAWHDYLMITMSLTSGYFWMNYLTDRWNSQKGKSRDIFLAFTFLGLAALSKYNSVFIALGIGSVILLNKPLRSILKDFRIYIGLILCAVIISPIFIWNIQNSFESFGFTLGKRTLGPFLRKEFFDGNFFGFILGSLILIPPTLWWVILRNKKMPKDIDLKELKTYNIVYLKTATHIFLWSSLTFLFLSNFSIVLYYWNIQAYIFILPLAIVYLLKTNQKLVNATLAYSAFANILFVIHFSVLPLNSFIDSAEDRDAAHHYGWEEIGNRVKEEINKNSEGVQLFTSSYRTTSLLSFELDRKDIFSYTEKPNQLSFWTKDIKYNNLDAIIITDDWKGFTDDLKKVLEKDIQMIDTIHIYKYGYKIKDYYMYSGFIKEEYLKK